MKETLITVLIVLLAIPSFIVLTIFLFLIFLFSRRLFYKYIGTACELFLVIVGIKLTVVGQVPNHERKYVILFNHASFIEIFLLPVLMKGQLYTGVTAKSNMRIPILGSIMKMANVFPIDRKSRENAISSMKEAEKILAKGYHMIMSPEGTRSLDGKLGKLKKGGFHIALNTNTEIIPVGIQGAFSYKPKLRKTIRPGKITMKIGKPISVEGYTKGSMEDLIKIVAQQIRELKGE